MRQDFRQTFAKLCTFSLYVKEKSTQPIFIIIKDDKYSPFSPAVQNTIVYIRVWKTIPRLLYLDERCVKYEATLNKDYYYYITWELCRNE